MTTRDEHQADGEFVERYTRHALSRRAHRLIRRRVEEIEQEGRRNRKGLMLFAFLSLLIILLIVLIIYTSTVPGS